MMVFRAEKRMHEAIRRQHVSIIVVVALVLVMLKATLAQSLAQEDAGDAEMITGHRNFMKAGSVYQNRYMSLYNANGGPISVTLYVKPQDQFEMRVEHLNSKDGSCNGWFALHGSFHISKLKGNSDIASIKPQPSSTRKTLVYDKKTLDGATKFAFDCLQHATTRLMGALELQVNMKDDAVMVTPQSSIVRTLWDEPVMLDLTSERALWKAEQGDSQTQRNLVVAEGQSTFRHLLGQPASAARVLLCISLVLTLLSVAGSQWRRSRCGLHQKHKAAGEASCCDLFTTA